MSKKKVRRNQYYNNLLVVEFHDRINYRSYWKCACKCGGYSSIDIIVREDHLLSGNTKSCGCLKREMYKRMKK